VELINANSFLEMGDLFTQGWSGGFKPWRRFSTAMPKYQILIMIYII